MGEYIRIQSNVDITVTNGLGHKDISNPDAHVPDRLKVIANWPKFTVDIHQGVGNYPAEIKEWNTVKALVKKGVFTISENVGDITEKEKEAKAKLDKANANVKEEPKQEEPSLAEEKPTTRRRSLNDITEE